MRLGQAINEKISMYDQIIFALQRPERAIDYSYADEVETMVDFLVEERQRLRTEYRMLEDGTHPIFA